MGKHSVVAGLAMLGFGIGCDAGNGDGGVEVVAGRAVGGAANVAVAILSPQPGAVVQNPVQVEVVLGGFELGVSTPGAEARGLMRAEGGQHLHLILDDGPYRSVFDASDPIDLGELTPGPHAVRVVPALEWHESVKGPGSFEAVQFFVAERTGSLPIRPGAPLLTYLRPVGTYAGSAADSVLLDFYVRNARLGPGRFEVRLTIDGRQREDLTEWVPYYLVGLTPGPHTLRLELRDAMGRLVPGPYNATERTITIAP